MIEEASGFILGTLLLHHQSSKETQMLQYNACACRETALDFTLCLYLFANRPNNFACGCLPQRRCCCLPRLLRRATFTVLLSIPTITVCFASTQRRSIKSSSAPMPLLFCHCWRFSFLRYSQSLLQVSPVVSRPFAHPLYCSQPINFFN